MRHQRDRGKLSRSASHRKALFMNLAREVVEHERVRTTEAKAKAVKPELERLITLAKRGDGHSRRPRTRGSDPSAPRGPLHQLEVDHLARVRLARPELEDPRVAARAVRIARRDLLEELVDQRSRTW